MAPLPLLRLRPTPTEPRAKQAVFMIRCGPKGRWFYSYGSSTGTRSTSPFCNSPFVAFLPYSIPSSCTVSSGVPQSGPAPYSADRSRIQARGDLLAMVGHATAKRICLGLRFLPDT